MVNLYIWLYWMVVQKDFIFVLFLFRINDSDQFTCLSERAFKMGPSHLFSRKIWKTFSKGNRKRWGWLVNNMCNAHPTVAASLGEGIRFWFVDWSSSRIQNRHQGAILNVLSDFPISLLVNIFKKVHGDFDCCIPGLNWHWHRCSTQIQNIWFHHLKQLPSQSCQAPLCQAGAARLWNG